MPRIDIGTATSLPGQWRSSAARRWSQLVGVIGFAVLLAGCGGSGFEVWDAPASEGLYAEDSLAERGRGFEGSSKSPRPALDPSATDGEGGASGATPVAATDRLRIYRADLTLGVGQVNEARDGFVDSCREAGGYLVRLEGSWVTCRVPAAKFDEVLASTRGLGMVRGESIDIQDVTREYKDLRIRLDNARKSRERLLELMAQAKEVEALIALEKELRRLTTEIESYESRIRELDELIAFSTITVRFQPLTPSSVVNPRTRSRFDWINQIGIEAVLESR